MENGTYHYDLVMDAPLGKRRGNLELMVEKNWMNGYLTMFTRTIPIRNGHLDGKRISFDGEMKTLMKTLPYKASGTISPSTVNLVIATEQGEYPVTGELAEVRR